MTSTFIRVYAMIHETDAFGTLAVRANLRIPVSPPSALQLRPIKVEIGLRNVRTRMTPKYGAAVLVACPIAHVRLAVEGPNGRGVEGLSGDCLPPGWYDKSPGRTFRQDVEDLCRALREASSVLLSLARGPTRSVFGYWQELYQHQIAWARQNNFTDLSGNFGTSMLERALIDAAGKWSGKPFHACVRDGLLGIEPGAVHSFLQGWSAFDALAPAPLAEISVRHTVGGADPLTAGDIAEGARLNDGLPQTLEEYLSGEHLRYFKVKLQGVETVDLERMEAIAALCDALIPAAQPYFVTLDGNEQFEDPGTLVRLLEKMCAGGVSERFARAVLFIEQPYPRAIALEDFLAPDLHRAARFKPLIIDESDENLQSVPRALELGYAGFAVKSAKGPIKALLNKGALTHHPQRPRAADAIMSGEDMLNLPVVPLHEDLVLLAAMGVSHAERNGHHFCRGLDHLTAGERRALLKNHPALYRQGPEDLVTLATRSGRLSLGSLNNRPGFGVDSESEVDWAGMQDLADWKFDSLGLE